jgi:hypothetical protein
LVKVSVWSAEVPIVTLPKGNLLEDTTSFGIRIGALVPLTLTVIFGSSGSVEGMSKLSLRVSSSVGE